MGNKKHIVVLCGLALMLVACKNDTELPINYNIVDDVQVYFDMTKPQMRRSLRRNYGTVRESRDMLRGRSRTQTLTIHFDDEDRPYRIDYKRDNALRSLDETAAVAQRLAADIHEFYTADTSVVYNYGSMACGGVELCRSADYTAFADSLAMYAGTFDRAEERYGASTDIYRGWIVDFGSVSDNLFQFSLVK